MACLLKDLDETVQEGQEPEDPFQKRSEHNTSDDGNVYCVFDRPLRIDVGSGRSRREHNEWGFKAIDGLPIASLSSA